jgi:hypothetical protein
MKAIKGRFDGSVVILEEPAPVDHEVPVIVEFPEPDSPARRSSGTPGRFHWEQAQAIEDDYAGSVADELIRQRRME